LASSAFASRHFFSLTLRPAPCSTLFPYKTLFRSLPQVQTAEQGTNLERGSKEIVGALQKAGLPKFEVVSTESVGPVIGANLTISDRKIRRVNSSHDQISYAVFCLKKKKQQISYLI